MKTSALALMAAVALTSPSARAGEDVTLVERSAEPNLLLVNPGDLINGVVSLEYERALNSFVGVELGFSVLSFRGAFAPYPQTTIIGLGPELGVRFHFIRPAPGGLWLGPSIDGVYLVNGAGTRVVGYGLGGAVGYNFTFGNHFVVQLGLGGSLNDYGEGLVWLPHFRLGLGGRF